MPLLAAVEHVGVRIIEHLDQQVGRRLVGAEPARMPGDVPDLVRTSVLTLCCVEWPDVRTVGRAGRPDLGLPLSAGYPAAREPVGQLLDLALGPEG